MTRSPCASAEAPNTPTKAHKITKPLANEFTDLTLFLLEVRNFLDSVKIGGRNVCREPYWKKLGRIYIGKGPEIKARYILSTLKRFGQHIFAVLNTFDRMPVNSSLRSPDIERATIVRSTHLPPRAGPTDARNQPRFETSRHAKTAEFPRFHLGILKLLI